MTKDSVLKEFTMNNSHFNYLLRLMDDLKKLSLDGNFKAFGSRLDELEADLKMAKHRLLVKRGAKIKEARSKSLVKLLHYQWAGEQPSELTYEEAAKILSWATSTLRVRISQAPGHAVAFYRGGHVQVLTRTPEGVELALRAKFNKTGNPDNLLSLTTKPRTSTSSRPSERAS
jgi:hypothetical protein